MKIHPAVCSALNCQAEAKTTYRFHVGFEQYVTLDLCHDHAGDALEELIDKCSAKDAMIFYKYVTGQGV